MTARDREPAVAGMFYPQSPRKLEEAVLAHLARASGPDAPPLPGTSPRAIVVPHAGYLYSGDVAGAAFAAVRQKPERVLLIGPAHRVGFRGVSAGCFAHYRVPTGASPVDLDACQSLIDLRLARFVEGAHAREHSLEVMIPFLLARFGEIPILPLLAGAEGDEGLLDAILDRAVRPGDLLLCSTDLSHFQPYASARERDLGTLDAVAEGRWEGIGPEDACGYRGLAATMRLAAGRGWTPRRLAYLNSGDTAGDKDRVVGYGAVAFG